MPPPGRKVATLPQKTASGKTVKTTAEPMRALGGRFLKTAKTEIAPRAAFLIILSAPGYGKSSLCAEFPDPVFICDANERGIEELKVRSLVPDNVAVLDPIRNWEEGLACLHEMAKFDHPFKTVVIEGLAGFQKFCFQHCCTKDYGGDWASEGRGFYSYYSGPKVSGKRYFPEFSDKIEAIRDQGVHVILTGHTNVKNKGNPGGADYMAEMVDCELEVWNSVHRAADAICVITDEVSVNTKGMKAKLNAKGHNRVLQCVAGGMYGGKNRWNLQEPIQTGESAEETFHNLCQAAQLDPTTAFYNR